MSTPTTNPLARAAKSGARRRRDAGETVVASDGTKVDIKKKGLMIQMSPQDHTDLKGMAALNGGTISAVVNGLIREYLTDRELAARVHRKYL